MREVYNKYKRLFRVDVFKNAHHNGDIGADIYKLTNAKYIVFTTCRGYYPSSSLLRKVRNLGMKVYIVSDGKDGNVHMWSNGKTIKVKTNR